MDVKPSGGGTVEVEQAAPSSYPTALSFKDGSYVHLEAVPAPGYHFDKWSGDLSGSTNPTAIVIDCHKTITANFSQVKPNRWFIGGTTAGVIIIGVIIWLAVRSKIA